MSNPKDQFLKSYIETDLPFDLESELKDSGHMAPRRSTRTKGWRKSYDVGRIPNKRILALQNRFK